MTADELSAFDVRGARMLEGVCCGDSLDLVAAASAAAALLREIGLCGTSALLSDAVIGASKRK